MTHTPVRRRILVVDDEEKVARGLQVGLETLPNCEVAVATGGEQALRFLEQRPFHLLVTDYQMPDMDGLMLAARVQRLHPETLIIVLTAYGCEVLADHATHGSIRCILDKPARLEDIRNAVLEALDG